MSVPAAAFALAAALLFALAAVAQQRVASRVPDDESLGLGLARRLVTSPLWLVASVGDLVGYGLQVESLLSFNQKFEPEWVPRSVIAERSADLAHVWFLYAGVEGMFARVPVLGALMTPPVVLESRLLDAES